MKIRNLFLLICAALVFSACGQKESNALQLNNYELWKDSEGNGIQAHDNIIKVGSKYYWYGMDYSHNRYIGDEKGFRAVKCYESEDLINWSLKNNVLTTVSNNLFYYCDLNSPSVVYNEKTGKYVMWLGYNAGNVLVATSDTPYDNFQVVKAPFSVNGGIRYHSIFKDEDNKAYLITYCYDDGDDVPKFFLYALTDDYLEIDDVNYSWGIVSMGYANAATGFGGIVKHNGWYYLFLGDFGDKDTNDDGWLDYSPYYHTFITRDNVYRGVSYAASKTLADLGKGGLNRFGPKTYNDQEFSSILTVRGEKNTEHILMFNKWNKTDLSKSQYVWQKLEWEKFSPTFDIPTFEDNNSLLIDAKTGTVEGLN